MPSRLRFIENAALLILLALIPLRVVLSEIHSFEVLGWLVTGADMPATAMPGSTFLVITLIAAVASVVFWMRLSYGGARRCTGVGLGLAVLVVGSAISCHFAGQKHLAIIGALDLLGLIVYCVTLRQLIYRPWHVRLALSVILATGAMVAVKCGYQKWVEMPATAAHYESHKAELLDAGRIPSEGLLHDFEQRLRSGSVSGYFGHPNVLGSYLILVISTGLALAFSRARRMPSWTMIAPIVIAAGAAVALAATLSKGACAACAIGLVFWGVCYVVQKRGPSRLREQALPAICIAAAAAGIALFATLQARPDVLGRSMLFRSMYWQGAEDMTTDLGYWGVGPGNFGRHFPKYKPVACPEDVDNPHSWIVTLGCEWGVVGLVGFVLILFGVLRRLAGTSESNAETRPDRAAAKPALVAQPVEHLVIRWGAGIGAFAFGWWLLTIGGSDPFYVAETILVAAGPWLIAFIGTSIESVDSRRFADDESGPLVLGLSAGLVGFLLHAGVDLALFNGGAATTFFAVVAVAIAARQMSEPSAVKEKRNPAIAVACAAGGFACVALLFTQLALPAIALGRELSTARQAAAASMEDPAIIPEISEAYVRAIEAYPLDSTAIGELIEDRIPRISSMGEADALLKWANLYRQRDPDDGSGWDYLAGIYTFRYGHSGDPADIQHAADAMRQRVACNPTSPRHRIALARVLESLAKATGSTEPLAAAAKELQTALDLDDERVYVSKPNRLKPEARRGIQDEISRLIPESGEGTVP